AAPQCAGGLVAYRDQTPRPDKGDRPPPQPACRWNRNCGIYLGEALGGRRVGAPAGGVGGEIGRASIHAVRIPKSRLIATHLQLHLAASVPGAALFCPPCREAG